MATLFFVNANPSATKRELELIDSARKSFAAKVSHAKRGAKSKSGASLLLHQRKKTGFAQKHHPYLKDPHSDEPLASDDVERNKHQDAYRALSTIPPSSLHKGETIDPFNTFPVALDAKDYSVLRYYLQFVSTLFYRTESMAVSPYSESDTYKPLVWDGLIVPLTMEATTYSILGVTSARMAMMNVSSSAFYEQQTDYYIYRALKSFRGSLAQGDQISKALRIAIMFRLAGAERSRGNHNTAQVHMKMLAVDLGSSFEKSAAIVGSERIASTMSRCDITMAAEWDTTPLLHLPPRMPSMSGDERKKIQQQVDLMHLDPSCGMLMGFKIKDAATFEDSVLERKRPLLIDGTRSSSFFDEELLKFSSQFLRGSFGCGFRELVEQDVLFPEFNAIITQIFPEWTDVLLLCFSDTSEAKPGDALWLGRRAHELLHDLLFLKSRTSNDLRQDALRRTLIIILTDMTSAVHWRAVAVCLRRLKRCLERLESIMKFKEAYFPSIVEGRLMLWILCIAMCATSAEHQKSDVVEKEVQWWKERAVNLCELLSIRTMDALFSVLVRYLHCGLVRHQRLVDLMCTVSARSVEQALQLTLSMQTPVTKTEPPD